ncbi:MAG: right-handed parallel beta-helix repeat-containing protein [Victivallaceae bacterium]
MKSLLKIYLCGIVCLLTLAVYCDVYDVTDYYQAGDISYAEAIVRAITAANANNGGVIYFPPGTYQVHQSISVKKNLTIEGNSGPGGSSVIQATGSSTFNLFTCFNANASNVVFKNLVIDMNNLSGGGDVTGIGIYIHNDTNWTGANPVTGTRIENCEIKNGSSHGIRGFSTSTDCSVPFELQIKNCKIHNCSLQGIFMQSGTSVVISGSEIYDCGQSAIYVMRGKNYVIDSCNIRNVGYHGITVCYATNWKVVNNTVTNCENWGICAGGGNSSLLHNTKYVISKNICLENGWGGITIDPTLEGLPDYLCPSYGVVSKNICSSSSLYHGIYINHPTNMIVKDNICHNNTHSGTLVYAKDCIISNNIFSGVDPNNNQNGIYLTNTTDTENILLDQNLIYKTYRTIYIADYVTNVFSSLSENLIP